MEANVVEFQSTRCLHGSGMGIGSILNDRIAIENFEHALDLRQTALKTRAAAGELVERLVKFLKIEQEDREHPHFERTAR